jgi:hypothetical protein
MEKKHRGSEVGACAAEAWEVAERAQGCEHA